MLRRVMLALSAWAVLSAAKVRPDEPKPSKALRDPQVGFRGVDYPQGIVTEVTKDSITVECPERMVQGARPGPGGTTIWEPKVLAAVPAKRFAVSEVLAAGGVPKEPRPGSFPYRVSENEMYRLTDVKVGDWVVIRYAQVVGVDTCDHIRIVKRPGGRVPPLPEGVKEISVIPYHERMNAHWDLEDKGIPFPESFARRGFPRSFPIAPMPREVPMPKPRGG
jgi:hypothetical protein